MMSPTKLYVAAGVAVVAGVAGLSTLMGSWYTIDEGERGVLLTNGAISEIVGPGLHWKIPWLQTVHTISLRQHVIYWTCPTGQQTCADDERRTMQAYSKDQQSADLKVTVNFHVPENEVAKVYTTYQTVDAVAAAVIARKAPQEIKVIFGQFDAVSVIQNRAKFNTEAAAALQKAADGPIIIDAVQIENIDFSDAYEQAVEARMTAQVEVQKQQQTLAQEQIKATIAVTQAKGRADSVKAEADAAAYKTKIEGEATADAIRARGSALTNNPLLVELTKAERWNGALPTSMIPGTAVPFIEVAKQ